MLGTIDFATGVNCNLHSVLDHVSVCMCVYAGSKHFPWPPVEEALYLPVRKSISQCRIGFSFDRDKLTSCHWGKASKETWCSVGVASGLHTLL